MNEKWRVGTKVPLNIYRDDVPICQCHSDIDSRFIVAGMNQVEYLLESERSLREQNDALNELRQIREEMKTADWVRRLGEIEARQREADESLTGVSKRVTAQPAGEPDPGQWKERT